jgi:hypothetical protein
MREDEREGWVFAIGAGPETTGVFTVSKTRLDGSPRDLKEAEQIGLEKARRSYRDLWHRLAANPRVALNVAQHAAGAIDDKSQEALTDARALTKAIVDLVANDPNNWCGQALSVVRAIAEFYRKVEYPGTHEAEEKAVVEAIAALSNVDPDWMHRVNRLSSWSISRGGARNWAED